MVGKPEQTLPRPTAVLWADIAVEFLIGLAAIALASTADRWFGISSGWFYVAGAVFLVAALAIVPIARRPRGRVVGWLAWGNIAGGTIAWAMLLLAWSGLEAEGRWLLAAVADAFLAIGLAVVPMRVAYRK